MPPCSASLAVEAAFASQLAEAMCSPQPIPSAARQRGRKPMSTALTTWTAFPVLPGISAWQLISAENVVTSTNPTGGSSAWTVTHLNGTGGFWGVFCPSVDLCVAVDQGGNLITSKNPAAGK